MKKLFVHIGMPRAGSSTIQTALYEHRAAFARGGLIYPLVDPAIVGSSDPAALYNHKALQKYRYGLFSGRLYRSAHADIAAKIAAADCPKALISYEGWWHPRRAAYLGETLTMLGAGDTTVVATVRDASAFLRSLYKLQVANLRTSDHFGAFARQSAGEPRLRYAAILDRLERAATGRPVSLRFIPYRTLAASGDLVSGFFREIGLEGEFAATGLGSSLDGVNNWREESYSDAYILLLLRAVAIVGRRRLGRNLTQFRAIHDDLRAAHDLSALRIRYRPSDFARLEGLVQKEMQAFWRRAFGADYEPVLPAGAVEEPDIDLRDFPALDRDLKAALARLR